VEDALSIQYEDKGSIFVLSLPVPNWIEEDRQEWLTHPTLSQVIQRLREDPNLPTDYTWKDNILRYKERLVLSMTSALKPRILNELHSSTIASYSDFQKTYAHAQHSFFWGRHEEGNPYLFHRM